MYKGILNNLEEIIKIAEKTLTFERVFDLTGITERLEEMYITPDIMIQEYVNMFYKSVEDFLKKPIYKNKKITNEKDLKIISEEPGFKDKDKIPPSAIESTILTIQSKLYPREDKLLKYFEKFESKSEIRLDDIINSLKFDKISLLFMLEHLKETNKILL